MVPIIDPGEIQSLLLASVAEQAGLSLTWSQTPKIVFLVMWLICSKVANGMANGVESGLWSDCF